jgi:hypothetical protein
VPVAPAVAGACELLGIDPMHVANEGVFVAIVAPAWSPPGFADIGEVKTEPPGMVLVETGFGGRGGVDGQLWATRAEDLLMHELRRSPRQSSRSPTPRGGAPPRGAVRGGRTATCVR